MSTVVLQQCLQQQRHYCLILNLRLFVMKQSDIDTDIITNFQARIQRCKQQQDELHKLIAQTNQNSVPQVTTTLPTMITPFIKSTQAPPPQLPTEEYTATKPLRIQSNFAQHKNQRQYMEDVIATYENLTLVPSQPEQYFCSIVCDGHGGDLAARFTINHYIGFLKQHAGKNPTSRPTTWLKHALINTMEKWDKINPDSSGTTVLVLLIDRLTHKAFICNLGDSRLVVVDLDRGKNVFTSTDHDLDSSEERKAVESRQLLATGKKCKVTQSSGEPRRINNSLAMSRSLGDNSSDLNGCIGREPDVEMIKLPKKFLIIQASDGLWDEESSSSSVLQQVLTSNAADLKLSSTLVTWARERGKAGDNISVIAVTSAF